MAWTVRVKKKVLKQIQKLPERIKKSLFTLLSEIEIAGPIRGNWSNYSSLGRGRHHCHLKKGNPTYVAVWEVKDKKMCLIEIIYAGTHEKASY